MRRRTLDGLEHLSDQTATPDDLAAIRWLNSNISGRPHILEAAEPQSNPSAKQSNTAYGETGRVSAYTGLPAIIGWDNHEAQWRGWDKYWNKIQVRQKIVREIYQSEDIERTARLLDDYAISLVFIGRLERAVYPAADLEKFKALGQEVFRSGKTVVYSIDPIAAGY